jgi:uncharacterized protein with GYD domain
MTAWVGLLKFNEPGRSGEEELAVGRAARGIADVHGKGGRFLSVLWGQRDYDMVLTLEAKDEAIATKVFKTLEEQENVTVQMSHALVMWEKELLVQGKPI